MTFDLHKGLSHVQDQIAATLRALSKPRPQTVTELVDSVRQQIAGGDCSPLAGQSVDDCVTGKNIKLREVLGEGTVRPLRVAQGQRRGKGVIAWTGSVCSNCKCKYVLVYGLKLGGRGRLRPRQGAARPGCTIVVFVIVVGECHIGGASQALAAGQHAVPQPWHLSGILAGLAV